MIALLRKLWCRWFHMRVNHGDYGLILVDSGGNAVCGKCLRRLT